MNTIYHAFLGARHRASGSLAEVLAACYPQRDGTPMPLIFDVSGHQIDFDWRGSLDEVLERATPAKRSGPGRPKLGVRSAEITLLPRHWEWLARQPARASGTIRRLVDAAMANEASDPKKRAEVLSRILWAVAGNEPGFEEVSRALYAGDLESAQRLANRWSGLAGFVRDFLTGEDYTQRNG